MDTSERFPTSAADRRIVLLGLGAAAASVATAAEAASRAQIDARADGTLSQLYATSPKARELVRRARGILIFPRILKAGFVFGGEGGEGVLRIGGRSDGYYSFVAGSFGFQLGAQAYSLAMFFMTRSALDYLRNSQGWALGGGPTIAVIDQGLAASLDTTNLSQPVYAEIFNQKGLMGGLTLNGSKITHIHPG